MRGTSTQRQHQEETMSMANLNPFKTLNPVKVTIGPMDRTVNKKNLDEGAYGMTGLLVQFEDKRTALHRYG
jgi:hypothetical protein